MNRILQTLRACCPATRLGAGVLALALAMTCISGLAFAQENPDPSLQGVLRSQIEANGLPASLITSARGVNQNGALQIPRSGFDLVNNGVVGTVLLRGVRLFPNPVACDALQDDAFFLVTVAGRPGDADGDGAFSTNAGLCAARRNNNPANPKIIDGTSVNDLGIFTFGENLRIRLDRNCDGKADLVFSLSNDPAVPTVVRVESDDFTGHAGQILGGRTVAWEAAVQPGTAYGQPCPDPATITGHYIIRIPNFSSFFTAPLTPGLNPTDFGFIITAGSDDDGLEEDLISGEVHKPEPRLSITKTPDLALCPAEEGNWTIHVSNDGNVTLKNLVVTDLLPAGVTFVNVVSGGVTASGTTTITFSAFDLAQCESKDIVFRVRANDNCSGNGINSASVAGVFESLCDLTNPGQLSSQPISAGPATANFTCKVKPCVTITLNPLDAQCPGTPVTVSGRAVNCGNGPERIFVRIGAGAETDLGIVDVGDANGVNFQLSAGNLDCKLGGATYTVNARATADCPPEGTDSKQVSILCLTSPCVTLSLDALPAQCPGSPVTVTGKATNCGSVAGHIFVQLGSGAEVDLGVVQPGAANAASFQLPAGNLVCVDGSATYTVNARAPGDCPPVATDSKQVTIQCLTAPCVTLALDPLAPQCPGTSVVVTGKATNCGTVAAHIFVQLGAGAEIDLGLVQPGAANAAPFQLAAGDLVCVDGSATYTVNARSPGDCPPAGTDSKQVTIQCIPGPCVNVTCTPDRTAACEGQTINLTVRGTNCSPGAERIVLRVGGQEFACPDPVASGDFCEHVFQVVMPPCTGGSDITFPSEATATNLCSSVTTVTPNPCSVACKVPNVDVSKSAEAEVQPGDQIHYTITVSNPSNNTDLEHVVVTDILCPEVSNPVNFGGTCNAGAPQVNGSTITWPEFNLPAGGSCTLTFEATAAGTPSTCTGDLTCHNVVNVTAKCGDASDQATASADTDIPCTPPGLCRLTGGGCLNEDGGNRGHKQSTFGGNASPAHDGGGPTGNEWEHVYRDGKTILFNWHSHDAHVILCTVVPPGPCSPHANNTKADFVGTGLYSIGAGGRDQEGNMVAYIIDHKEGACNKDRRDEYSIVIRTGLVIGQGDIVFQTSGEIDCGNLQIHETPARLFGSGTQLPTPDSQVESVALLNTVIPNPFASSMSFAYQVPEEGAAVEIGIYNVAGRLVKTLASGTQSAGRQAVTWDGTDSAGIRMARGMYFLKSVVGGKLNSYRVIFVAR